MRHLLCFLALPLVVEGQIVTRMPVPASDSAAPKVKPEDLCTIEGQVVNAATGEPIKKASVRMRRTDAPAGGPFLQPPIYTSSSDGGGKFTITGLEPGKYLLTASRNGFVESIYGSRGPGRPGTTLSLDAGQNLTETVLRMTPHGVITGRVVDEDGEPVAYVQMEALRSQYLQGRKSLMPAGSGSTDDLGQYRIFGLAPGHYLLSAAKSRDIMVEAYQERTSGPVAEEAYVPTYYPGTTDASSAAGIEVQLGAQLQGMDLTLSKARAVRIRGRVVNATGVRSSHIQVMLQDRERFGFYTTGRGAVPDREGRFEIRGVVPGAYNLTAQFFEDQKIFAASEPVDVGSASLENVSLVLQPAVEVKGEVRVEGQRLANLSDLHMNLQNRDSMFGLSTGVKDDGSFTFAGVGPMSYTVSVAGLSDGYFLKAILMADKEVLDSGIDLSKGAAGPLTVVLSPNAAQVEGVALNAKQQPAPGVSVVLIPKDEKRRERSQNYKTTTTDQYGRYTLKNVTPGEYRVFAWETVENGAYMDPDFVKPVEDRGESVSLGEKAHQSVQVNVLAAADSTPAPSSQSQ